jgi:hypothetical protein
MRSSGIGLNFKEFNFSTTLIDPIIAFAGVDFAMQEWFDQDDNPVNFRLLDANTLTVVGGNSIASSNPSIGANTITTSAVGRVQIIGNVIAGS